MHKYAKELMDQLKPEIDSVKSSGCIDSQTIEDLKNWTCIVNNIVSFDKEYKIVEAMEKSNDVDEIMEKIGQYEPERMYYNNNRYANGRYAPRHGYEHRYDDRDMDVHDGRMYYSGDGYNMHNGKSYMTRRGYMETKEVHKSNSPEDKQAKMHELEKYSKDLMDDVLEMVADATPEEKTMLKTKLTNLASKI